MKTTDNLQEVFAYVDRVITGEKPSCIEEIDACKRFLKDLENPDYELRTKPPEFVIRIIEKTFVHLKGQDMNGHPLRGKPFILQPWQKFIVYNLLGFYHVGTDIRKIHEAFIMVPRKQGKTPFVSALAWGLALLERKTGADIVIAAALLKQALQSFNFLLENLEQMGEKGNFRILDNNQEHSIEGKLDDGYIRIEALAGNSDRMDSLNTLIQILDELHLYKSPSQYTTIKDSGKANRNSMCIGITTAGDNPASFAFNRMKYGQKVLNGTVTDEQLFVFITKADEAENGDVDYTDPIQHIKATPNINVTISASELMGEALQALNDPQQRKTFLAKSLNIYTSALKAYFNIDEFIKSDKKYSWTLEELAKLPVKWYGGADLSRMHDLTAAALYGNYEGVDIVVTHAFFPRPMAHIKAEEDNIPLFGWLDDGLLTMSNAATVDYNDIVKWFLKMRAMGFQIESVGFDRKFGREFFMKMKSHKFRIEDTPQLYYLKSEGFRRIEKQVKDELFYYLHSQAFEYCVQNVKAIEQDDDAVRYEKVMDAMRIDLFDASVFSCMQMLKRLNKSESAKKWLKGGNDED